MDEVAIQTTQVEQVSLEDVLAMSDQEFEDFLDGSDDVEFVQIDEDLGTEEEEVILM